MAQLYRIIVHAADGAYYQEGPVTFADQRVARMHKIVTDEIQPKQCVSLQMILRRSLDWAKC